MSNKQDISKLLKTIEENFNVDISRILKNDFCLACYFSLIGEKDASTKILDNIIDAVSLDKRKTYFINIKDSIDEHAVTYAKEINASSQIINLIDYLTEEKTVKNQTMSRKQYITALYSHFTGPFLVGLAEKSPSVLSELERCRCKIDASHSVVSVEFQLGDLFDALWRHAVFSNINLPSQSGWGKDFKEFCRQLTVSWPTTQFKALGFRLERLHKSNSYARSLYKISPV